MRRHSPCAVVFALSLSLAGCTLPSRDNNHDPANAPIARLSIVDHTNVETGACETSFGAPGAYPSVGGATRQRCIALDASLTTDPQGTDLSKLTFRFGTTSSAGFAAFTPADGITSAGPSGSVAVLGEEYRSALVPHSAVRFAVEVRDPKGAVGRAEATLLVLNAPPVVRNATRITLPIGGFPWDAGVAVPVAFHAEASDPDGDEVEYC